MSQASNKMTEHAENAEAVYKPSEHGASFSSLSSSPCSSSRS